MTAESPIDPALLQRVRQEARDLDLVVDLMAVGVDLDIVTDVEDRLRELRDQVQPPAPARTGRPRKLPWDEAVRELVLDRMHHHGDFDACDPTWDAQARLEEAVEKFCVKRFGVRPGEATIRAYVGRYVAEWRASKALVGKSRP